MNLTKGMGKTKELLGKSKEVFGAIPRAMINAFDSLTAVLHRDRPAGKPLFIGRFHNLFREKKKPLLFALGGLVVLLLILMISVQALNSGKSKKPAAYEGVQASGTPKGTGAGPVIPLEDIFLPAEPDFLPAFLFERQPRQVWTIEDIRPYWKIPEKTGLWQKEIKSAVDKLMEGVP